MLQSKNHPAWDVYDLYRTIRMNIKYYSARLDVTERVNFWVEVILAASASSSVIASLAFWTTTYGRYAWQLFTVISAIVAVIKPLLGLTEKIRQLQETTTQYRLLEQDVKKIEVSIRQQQSFDREHSDQFLAAIDKMKSIVAKTPESRIDEKLRKKCTDEVKKELPESYFYIPEEKSHVKKTKVQTAS